MAERSVTAPTVRLLWLSLTVLVVLTAFNRSLHPLVQGFGLAHARMLDSQLPAVLVVDNLQRSDVPALQQVFSGDIWARKAYRVPEILLPTLILALAMGLLARFLSLGFLTALDSLGRIRLLVPTPMPSMGIGLLFGGVVGCASPGRFPSETAFLPFVIAVSAVAVTSLVPRPKADKVGRALEMVGASRWFWLGYTAIACLHRPDVSGPTRILDGSTMPTVVVVAVGFLLLHWATRPPARIDLRHLDGDRQSLVALCDRLTVLSIHELWIVLPLLLLSLSLFPEVSQGVLSYYLLTSIVSGLLMKWALEGRPPGGNGGLARLAGSLWRVATLALVLALPPFVTWDLFGEPSTQSWFIASLVIGLGLVRGQPWFSQKRFDDFANCAQHESVASPPKRLRRPGSVLAGLGAVAALFLAIGSAAYVDRDSVPDRDPVLGIRSKLEDSFGYRVRYVRYSEGSVLLGESLSTAQRSQAQQIVRRHLPNERIAVVGVQIWRWELAAMAFVVLSLAAVIVVVPATMLGALSPFRPSFGLFFVALAGANGAFALGAQWGWFWLDPLTHGAAFLLCVMGASGLGWVSEGRARGRAANVSPLQKNAATPPPPLAADPQLAASGLAGTPDDPSYRVMRVAPLCVELGTGLLDLVDPRQGAKLVERVSRIRRYIATEMGIVMPGVRFRDNLQLDPDAFVIKVREVQVARGTLDMQRFLAIGPENKLDVLSGTRTVDPTYGMPGVWIDAASRPKAEGVGCMIFDPVSVVATLLTEVCRRYSRAFLTLEAMATILDQVAKDCPTTVALVREKHSLVVLRDVYRGLLAERVSVRDHETILNVLAATDGPVDALIAECRQELKVAICSEYTAEKILHHIRLDSDLERELLAILRSTGWPEGTADRYQERLLASLDVVIDRGIQPVFVVHPRLRAPFGGLMSSLVASVGGVVVLGTNEIPKDVQLNIVTTAL